LSDRYDIDILSFSQITPSVQDFFKDSNINFLYMDRLKESGYRRYKKQLSHYFKLKQYDVVHIHTGLLSWITAKVAKKYGVKVRVAHGHGQEGSINKLLLKIFQHLNRKYCTDFVGCAQESLNYNFGGKGIIIPNYIPWKLIEKFDNKKRQDLRKKFNVSKDTTVLGYCGNLDGIKNTNFLIDFANYIRDKKVLFLLAGNSKNMDNFKQKVADNQLEDKVKLLGFRTDINDLYNVFDMYITSSKFEGMSLSIIQAQMMGLPCIVSDKIPKMNDLGLGLYIANKTFENDEWKSNFEKAKILQNTKNINEIKKLLKANKSGEDWVVEMLIKIYQG